MGLSHAEIQAALPEGGLFAGKDWLTSPEPLKISKREGRDIERLGRGLIRFQEACERIYRRSAKSGRDDSPDFHPWLAELIDAGKPSWIVEAQSSPELNDLRPRVIRPDLLLTENGMAIAELDAVPGGIGLTAWLSDLYTEGGFDLLGSEQGMKGGFRSLFPEEGGRILISDESGDYLPEMEWLATQLEGLSVERAETAQLSTENKDEALYRFFELFDWENISAAQALAKHPQLTPPFKPLHEEKLWLALLWCPAFRGVWKEELRGRHLQTLRELVPFGWVLDPAQLPPHAALPKLGVQSWSEVGKMSQKERRLVLKISGFNERAWGSRGVVIGHDEPSEKWAQSIHNALDEFPTSPWLMQDFADGRLVEHPYYDRETGELKTMKGRVRLCPYYFRPLSGGVELGGCLATIVPADKKKIHGMEDAILVPVTVVD